jgi:hypothetical protein
MPKKQAATRPVAVQEWWRRVSVENDLETAVSGTQITVAIYRNWRRK